jgi:predicted P-loop ATPase
MLDHALAAATLGPVFPVYTTISGKCSCGRDCGKNAGKHPRIKDWPALASQNPEQIRKWWGKWPQSNIGLATGHGTVVVDLDSLEQLERLRELCKEHGGLPRTLTARTGRGLHLYFTGDVGSSHVRDGIRFQGKGAFVVVAPSLHHSGRRYEWLTTGSFDGKSGSNVPVAELPEWLRTWAQVSENKGSTAIDWSVLGPRPAYLVQDEGSSDGIADTARNALKELNTWSEHEHRRVEAALCSIPASCGRDVWLRVGMALHSLQWQRPDGSDGGFEIFDRWSSTCPEKYTLYACEVAWQSFKRGGVTIASLFHLAHEHGWKGDIPGMLQNASPGTKSGTNDSDGKINGATFDFGATAPPPSRQIIFPDTDKGGNPKPTCRNTILAIGGLGIACAHDTFHDKLSIGGQLVAQWAGDVTDYAVHAVRMLVREQYSFDPPTATAFDATVQLALAHSYDPVVQYLNALTWDGRSRLDGWLPNYMQALDTELNRMIGRLALIAAVRRARQPGTKFDQIIVLEGIEGRGKSTALEIMAGKENFSDQPILSLAAREQQEAVQGIWLYEIGELDGIRRAEVEHVKAFASRTIDRARPAYGRTRQDRPRRCIFFATTNDQTPYLVSQTGNRRFWPVRTGHVDIEGIARDRDQLWAEAALLEQHGTSIVLPERLWSVAGAEQENRRLHDPWEDILENIERRECRRLVQSEDGKTSVAGSGPVWLVETARGPETEFRITTEDLVGMILRIEVSQQSTLAYKRAAQIMRRFGWEGPAPIWVNKQKFRGFWKPFVAK